MRSAFARGLLFVLALAAAGAVPAGAGGRLPRGPHRPDFVPDEIVVALPAGASFTRGAHGEAVLDDARRVALLARQGLVPVRVLGGGADRSAHRLDGRAARTGGRFALLRGAGPGFDPVAAAAALRASGLFAAACPNYEMRLFATVPNDTYVPDQWYVPGTTSDDIRLPLAWDLSKGSASVVIAILDTGVDTGHPDLATKIWTNPDEIAGNLLDDDGNGLVDDTKGWDFGDGDNDPDPAPMFDDIGLDEGFHGTFCAGIAAAATDNVEGIAGAGWNCRIMALRVFDSAGAASTASITEAIDYAIGEGASIISMSFGAPDEPGLPEFFQALVDAANAAGVVCVAAAGNDGTDTPLIYPAACDHVIAVAATTPDNLRADFSNWGAWVDLAAPGDGVWSSICRNYVIDDLSQIFYLFFFGWDGENPYMSGSGTSFACPLVAGICGLVRAQEPSLTPDQLAARLVATGDAVAYDLPIGPRVNAYAAVLAGTTAVGDRLDPARLSLGLPSPNPSGGLTRLGFTLPEEGPVDLAIFDAGGRRVRELAAGRLPAGSHEVIWDGRDAAGLTAPAGLYFARLTQHGRTRGTRIVRLAR